MNYRAMIKAFAKDIDTTNVKCLIEDGWEERTAYASVLKSEGSLLDSFIDFMSMHMLKREDAIYGDILDELIKRDKENNINEKRI